MSKTTVNTIRTIALALIGIVFICIIAIILVWTIIPDQWKPVPIRPVFSETLYTARDTFRYWARANIITDGNNLALLDCTLNSILIINKDNTCLETQYQSSNKKLSFNNTLQRSQISYSFSPKKQNEILNEEFIVHDKSGAQFCVCMTRTENTVEIGYPRDSTNRISLLINENTAYYIKNNKCEKWFLAPNAVAKFKKVCNEAILHDFYQEIKTVNGYSYQESLSDPEK
jgi:hypothetical protein